MDFAGGELAAVDDFVPGFFIHVGAGEDAFVAVAEETGELRVALGFEAERCGGVVDDGEDLVVSGFIKEKSGDGGRVDGVVAEGGDEVCEMGLRGGWGGFLLWLEFVERR